MANFHLDIPFHLREGWCDILKEVEGLDRGNFFSYIFVLVVSVLSKMLDSAATHGLFSYHPKCHKIRLTHFAFANDLLVFSKGNLGSVVGIHCILQ